MRVLLLLTLAFLAASPSGPAYRTDTTRLVRVWNRAEDSGGTRPAKPGEMLWLAAESITPPVAATLGASFLFERGPSSTEPSSEILAALESKVESLTTDGFHWALNLSCGAPGKGEPVLASGLATGDLGLISPWDPLFQNQAEEILGMLQRRFARVPPSHVSIAMMNGTLGLYRSGRPARHDWYCRDRFASKDFRDEMMRSYRSLRSLNRAWGTSYRRREEIDFPTAPRARSHWLDFVHWYQRRITESAVRLMGLAREGMPETVPVLPLPANLDARSGMAFTSLVKSASDRAVVSVPVVEPNGGAALAARLVSTASRFYRTAMAAELPAGVSSGSLFSAFELAASGLLLRPPFGSSSANTLYRMSRHLRMSERSVDVAMLYPTTSRFLDPNPASSMLAKGCVEIRDVLDFDIVDEPLILDGALDRYRILVIWEGTVYEQDTLDRIADWVKNGGVIAAYDFGKIESVEGSREWFNELFAHASRLSAATIKRGRAPGPAVRKEARVDLKALKRQWARRIGRGWAVFFPAQKGALDGFYEIVRFLDYRLSELDKELKSAIAFDNSWDGVLTTAFPDHILAYNSGLTDIVFRISHQQGAPGAAQRIPRRDIGVIPLTEPAPELLLQCEKFTMTGGLPPQTGAAHSPGSGLSHILIPVGGNITTRFQCDKDGRYRVHYRAVRRGARAQVEIEIEGKTLQGGETPSGPRIDSATLYAGDVNLKRGVRRMTIRPRKGEDVRADYIVLTTDRSIGGYAFPALPSAK